MRTPGFLTDSESQPRDPLDHRQKYRYAGPPAGPAQTLVIPQGWGCVCTDCVLGKKACCCAVGGCGIENC